MGDTKTSLTGNLGMPVGFAIGQLLAGAAKSGLKGDSAGERLERRIDAISRLVDFSERATIGELRFLTEILEKAQGRHPDDGPPLIAAALETATLELTCWHVSRPRAAKAVAPRPS